jgi:hypothetical protein
MHQQTGGGCTAFQRDLPDGRYLLITCEDDPSAPEKASEPCVLSMNSDNGTEDTWHAANVAEALAIAERVICGELVVLLEHQIAARGLDLLSDEQMALLESDSAADEAERVGMLEDLRDRVGLVVPDECFPCITDEERSNGPRH